MQRRVCGLLLLACGWLGVLLPGFAAAQPSALASREWTSFQRRFLAADGRVIDTGNAGISHSEGQGYGMLVAVHVGDRERFEQMWRWTRQNLSRPTDSLHAWRFIPDARMAVRDLNNATDGDLLIAWALARAARQWNEPAYRRAATRIATDILACCVRVAGGRTLLLPGAAGFAGRGEFVVNPSYWQFQAIRAMSQLVADSRWAALETTGLALLQQARFGAWNLPPDWLVVPARSGPLRPAADRPPRFSWDALRVPLHLSWQRAPTEMLAPAVAFWTDARHAYHPPAWTDLRTNAIAPYRGHAGVQAVMEVSSARQAGHSASLPRVASAPDYYAAALILMAILSVEAPQETMAIPRAAPAAPEGPARWIARWFDAASDDPAEALPADLPDARESRWTRNSYPANAQPVRRRL